MYPVLIDWGPVFLPSWHFFYVISAIVCYFLVLKLRESFVSEVGIGEINSIYVLAYVSSYIGARALTIIAEKESYTGIAGFFTLLFSIGGLTFYGGFLFSVFLCVIYVLIRKLPIWKLLDISTVSLFFSLAIARVGCFLNGCDYGIPVRQAEDGGFPFWAVVFPVLEDAIPRYPTQLMESVLVGIMASAVLAGYGHLKEKMVDGGIGLLSILGYATIRFFVEYYRGDERGWVVHDMISTSQFISLCLILSVLLIFLLRGVRRTLSNSP
ncbi:MAG: prolipoprotein diacylglyceryl transferase [Oligoflexales bacterium]|nr:prolipoprotein diacylglyceryl transferase [Oligoflexales bacterium]